VKLAVSPGANSPVAEQVVVPALPLDGDTQLNVRGLSCINGEKLVAGKASVEKALEAGSRRNLTESEFRSVLSAEDDPKVVFGIILVDTKEFRVNDTKVVFGSVMSAK